MNDASALENLAKRLKAAKSFDRVIDRDIAGVIAGKPLGWLQSSPHYTRSFEAALTLLPPLVYVEVSGGTDTGQEGVWPAVSIRWLPPGQTDPKAWMGTVAGAPTFALAMCRAAIEVRSRMAGNPAQH
jgi:hypothetical protein